MTSTFRAWPRNGQWCRIDGHLAIHVSDGDFHLVDENGETVMKGGATYVLSLLERVEWLFARARARETPFEEHVRKADGEGDYWIDGRLVHALAETVSIELLGPERPPTLGRRSMIGTAAAEMVPAEEAGR